LGQDDQWNVLVRNAKGNRDLRPMSPTGITGRLLNIIERAGAHVNCINEVAGDEGTWRTTVTVDSGAVGSVGPPTMAIGVKIDDPPASRAGLKHRAANEDIQ